MMVMMRTNKRKNTKKSIGRRRQRINGCVRVEFDTSSFHWVVGSFDLTVPRTAA